MRGLIPALLVLVPVAMIQEEADSRTPRGRYGALLKEFERRDARATAAYGAARTEEEKEEAAGEGRRVLDDCVGRFLGLAEEAPESDVARDALLWIIETGRWADDNAPRLARPVGRAMELITRHHLGDERVGRACLVLVNYPSPNRDAFLRAVLEGASEREVRGRACLALAQYLVAKAGLVRELGQVTEESLRLVEQRYGRDYLRHLRECDPRAMLAEAEDLCERVVGEYGDVPYIVGTRGPRAEATRAGGTTLGEVAARCLREIRDVAIGRPAPEIVGEDAEGKRFNLGDYRGKVVVLAFSGNWCGPCRALYPRERELAERLKTRPFALLGVNTDADRETLRGSTDAGEITWRCWWDGSGGPICAAWNVTSFPTVYVLDAGGVIRHKDLAAEDLDRAVETLLKEMEEATKP